MKAQELMLGDLVLYNNMVCKVYCIESPFERKDEKFNNKYIITLYCNGFIYATEDEIKSIQFTEEILKSFGFKKDGYTNLSPDYYYEDDECSIYINLKTTGDKQSIIDVSIKAINQKHIEISGRNINSVYVHELQHALHSCGLYNFLNNL